MRYEIGIALVSVTLFAAGWAWRRHVLAHLPGLRRRRAQALRAMIDIPLAELVPPVAVRAPIGAIRRRPF
jgi:hypothetical protein